MCILCSADSLPSTISRPAVTDCRCITEHNCHLLYPVCCIHHAMYISCMLRVCCRSQVWISDTQAAAVIGGENVETSPLVEGLSWASVFFMIGFCAIETMPLVELSAIYFTEKTQKVSDVPLARQWTGWTGLQRQAHKVPVREKTSSLTSSILALYRRQRSWVSERFRPNKVIQLKVMQPMYQTAAAVHPPDTKRRRTSLTGTARPVHM